MRLYFGFQSDDDSIARLIDGLTDQLPDARHPVNSRKLMAAALLEASARMGVQERRRLQIDLAEMALRILEGGSYAWPRLE
jgi:hypothetical protein